MSAIASSIAASTLTAPPTPSLVPASTPPIAVAAAAPTRAVGRARTASCAVTLLPCVDKPLVLAVTRVQWLASWSRHDIVLLKELVNTT